MSLDCCPGCGRKGKAGLTHNYFHVYTCSNCGHRYCAECKGSNGARKCPKCGETIEGEMTVCWKCETEKPHSNM